MYETQVENDPEGSDEVNLTCGNGNEDEMRVLVPW